MIKFNAKEITEPIRIIIGASSQTYPGWIQTQEEELNLLARTDWESSFKSRRIKAILAEHVWEHLTYEEGVEAARICYEFLEPQGYIRCAVPDAFFQNEWYQNIVKVGDLVRKIIQLQVIKLYITIGQLRVCSKKQDSK